MNRLYRREIKNEKYQKLSKRSSSRRNPLHTQETINGFNIIELNEVEINSDIISDLPDISENDIIRIKKKAQSIETYYLGKGDDAKINENCFNCLMKDFQPNELLYFSKRNDLLTYLRYCFYFLKKTIFLDNQIYTDNKYDLDKCDTNYLAGWKFFIPKTMCKACFLQMINMEHLFGNLKTIFSDVDATTYRKHFRRNRTHFNQRMKSDIFSDKNERGISGRKGLGIGQRRKKFRYSIKNKNNNISFDDKNKSIIFNKNILSGKFGENSKDKKEPGYKKKFIGKKKNRDVNLHKEQLVTEIKIKTNEFMNEKNLSLKEKNNDNNSNKEIKTIIFDKFRDSNNNLNNLDMTKKNKFSLSMKNILITDKRNNQKNLPENNAQISKEKKIAMIYQEIMGMKSMNNKIVMKLKYKLDALFYWKHYLICDAGDFISRLKNTLNQNPFMFGNLLANQLSNYLNDFRWLYNQVFKSTKEFEEIFKKIKNEAIPSISKNLLKLKEQTILKEEEIKILDEMSKTFEDSARDINELEIKYDNQIKNNFNNFICFMNLIEDIKKSFS